MAITRQWDKPWDRYNLRRSEAINKGGKVDIDYTSDFFSEKNYNQLLEESDKSILQLGVSHGEFVKEKQKLGWKIIGYDFSEFSINMLKGVPELTVKQIDLNEMRDGKLTYEMSLQEDLKQVGNVLAINVLSYLSDQALAVLIPLIVDSAKPDTLLFISNVCYEASKVTSTEKQSDLKKEGYLPLGYLPALFNKNNKIKVEDQKVKPKKHPISKNDELYCETLALRKL